MTDKAGEGPDEFYESDGALQGKIESLQVDLAAAKSKAWTLEIRARGAEGQIELLEKVLADERAKVEQLEHRMSALKKAALETLLYLTGDGSTSS